jgi:hypothetical protein
VGFQTFIPEFWAGTVLAALQKQLVAGSLCNRDYEGEIANAGDTVRINSIGDPTVADYTANSTSISPETLTTAQQSLTVDQQKYFAFKIDDIDKRQAAGNAMPEAMRRAAYKLADAADQYIIGLYTGADAANALGTIAITTADLAYQKLVALRTALNKANVPQAGRWVMVPPWYEGWLLDNAKFVANPSLAASGGNLENGRIGRAAGFDVYVSNNLPLVTGDDWLVMAGTPDAITFASQINSVEAYRPEASFSDAVKGLYTYGAKLVRPSCIATMVASIT